MKMKALTIYPSYAMLICTGAKKYETRTWSTEHRGLLAIHASKFKSWPPRERERFWDHPMYDHFRSLGFDNPEQLPAGAIIGQVRIENVMVIRTDLLRQIGNDEFNLGAWRPGNLAWELAEPVLYPEPIEHRGMQGLWSVEL